MTSSSQRVRIALVDTGVGNRSSMITGLRRAADASGLRTQLEATSDPVRLREAEAVVIPGVGSFRAGMAQLAEAGLIEPLLARVHEGRPTLGVCLGLQLWASSSAESRGFRGMGLFDLPVEPLPVSATVPQLGWNSVVTDPGCELLEEGWAAYANSFALRSKPTGWRAAWSDHGRRFVAGLERGDVLMCQFHPELSGPYGGRLLSKFLERAAQASTQPNNSESTGSFPKEDSQCSLLA